MAWCVDDVLVYKNLIVGGNEQSCVGAGNNALNGSVSIYGVLHVGAESFSRGLSSLMVAKSDEQTGGFAAYVRDDMRIENQLKVNRINSQTIQNSGTVRTRVCRGISLSFASKSFEIDHPSKPGMKLWHGCLEGPEHAVYVRGRLRNRDTIYLPDFWENLVDPNTITVSLTPIGAHNHLIVKRVQKDQVVIQSQGGMPIDCYYHVFAERIDVPKLEVEVPNANS